MKLSAIILAGGLSTRMTFNKEFLQLNGEYIVHQQIKQLQPLFDEIIVVSPHPEQYNGLDVVVVSDLLEGNSPIIGLHAGLFHAQHEYAFVIACDMPFINVDYITYLIQQIDNHDAYVVKRNRFIEPFQAIYHKRILPLIETLVKKQAFGF